jgi:hypothetical protein
VVVLAKGDAAATACSTSMDFACDLFAEDGELSRSAVANKLIVYPVGVIPRFLVRLYYLIH